MKIRLKHRLINSEYSLKMIICDCQWISELIRNFDHNSDISEITIKLVGDFDFNSDISEIIVELIGEFGTLF